MVGAEQAQITEEQRQLGQSLDDLLARLKRDCPLVPPAATKAVRK